MNNTNINERLKSIDIQQYKFEEGLGPITHINPEHWVWSVDINLLKNSLIEG